MKYMKLFLAINLALLITHCGQENGSTKRAKTSFQDLSPTLKRANCLSGVYKTKADIDAGLGAMLDDDAQIQISIAHNSNNNDAKAIVLIEELTDDSAEATTKPDSAVCSTFHNLQYTANTAYNGQYSELITENIENKGSLESVFGIQNSIVFQELSGLQGLGCEIIRIVLAEEDGSEQDMIFRIKLQENTIAPRYEDLEQKCMKLKHNKLGNEINKNSESISLKNLQK